MIRISAAWSAWAALGLSWSAHARTFTLAESKSLAAEQHSDVRLAELNRDEAEAGVMAARSRLYPQLSTSFGGSPAIDREPGFWGARVDLNQMLYDGGATLHRIELAKHQVKHGETMLGVRRQAARTRAITEFYALFMAQLRAARAEEFDRRVTQILDYAEKGFKGKVVGLADLLMMRVERSKRQAARMQAELGLRQAMRDFRLAIGQEGEEPVETSVTLPIAFEPLRPLGDTMANVMRADPRLAVLKEQTEELALERSLTFANHYPKAYALAFYAVSSHSDKEIFWSSSGEEISSSSNEKRGVGAVLSIPIFTGFSSVAQRRQYAERDAKLKIQQGIDTRQARFEVDDLYRRLEFLSESFSLVENRYSTAKLVYRELDKGFRVGVTRVPDLLLALNEQFDAEEAWVSTQVNYKSSLEVLKEISGAEAN